MKEETCLHFLFLFFGCFPLLTQVDHKDENSDSLRRFSALWDEKYVKDSLLVYSTGRSPSLYLELKAQKPLRTPGMLQWHPMQGPSIIRKSVNLCSRSWRYCPQRSMLLFRSLGRSNEYIHSTLRLLRWGPV